MKNNSLTQKQSPKTQTVFIGSGISMSAAIGKAHVINSGLGQVPKYHVSKTDIPGEVKRFRNAVAKAQKQIARLKAKTSSLTDATAEELELLLDAHAAMLVSTRMLSGIEKNIAELNVNAEAALEIVVEEIARGFEKVKDAYLAARVQDIKDVGSRILRQLMKTPYQVYSKIPKGSIVVAQELSPADTALMDPAHIAGLITEQGGSDGHTAIMARSLNIPAVLGVAKILSKICNGDIIIVDGDNGRVIVSPDLDTLEEFKRKTEARRRLNRQLTRLRSLPAVTQDGVLVGMHANIELARDVEGAMHAGAEGIGLLRTEFMFLNRSSAPTEEDQYQTLKTIVTEMSGRPVTVRTFDLSTDNLPQSKNTRTNKSTNPLLGLRAVRLSLRQQRLFEIQLSAILRASVHGEIRILLPMVSSIHQVREVKKILRRVHSRLLKQDKIATDKVPPLGAMIEVPGAALIADSIIQEVDFLAIGTNDLTMYTLAIDREDEQVSHLFNPLHPAVLQLIQVTLQAAHRSKKPVSICGEIAGDPRFAPLLIGLGVRELSMTSQNLPRVKQRIRALKTGPATRRAMAILDQTDEDQVQRLLDDFNEGI
tara:strand:+ start:74 stop:1858 length:1785 start_codon:yes stop_codon:yes gene_type:complete